MTNHEIRRNRNLELEVSHIRVTEVQENKSIPVLYSREEVKPEIEEILQNADVHGNYSVGMSRGALNGVHTGRIEDVYFDTTFQSKILDSYFGESLSFSEFEMLGRPRRLLVKASILYSNGKN